MKIQEVKFERRQGDDGFSILSPILLWCIRTCSMRNDAFTLKKFLKRLRHIFTPQESEPKILMLLKS